MPNKEKIKQNFTNQQRLEFVKQIEYFYEVAQADWKKIITFSFLKGIATGLGVFLGGTIMVGLLLWMLSQLSWLPFVGDLSQAAEQSIQQNQQTGN